MSDATTAKPLIRRRYFAKGDGGWVWLDRETARALLRWMQLPINYEDLAGIKVASVLDGAEPAKTERP